MFRLRSLCAMLSLVCAASASATILTFDQNPIPAPVYQDYGDNTTATSQNGATYEMGGGWTPAISVTYRSLNPSTFAVTCECAGVWGGGYGDLSNVLQASGSGDMLEVVFTPAPGVEVRLNSFDLSAFNVDQLSQPVLVLDDAGLTAADIGPLDARCYESGTANRTHVHVNVGVQLSAPLHLRVGNTYNVGIDNVDFSQIGTSPAQPSTWGAVKALYR